ncbi:hypothetical protein F441_20249 [Phytophthora nicotianae CJ01A1]|uniref:Uncharacterized protein n=1 Tax=Phytophthora nicotianae CJ01A1 TaxID=1317063 RepID=W2VZF0_PHYNI|nr:hypothetical protein F441_20249 [Phytophthora nicotianae CJ01A1]
MAVARRPVLADFRLVAAAFLSVAVYLLSVTVDGRSVATSTNDFGERVIGHPVNDDICPIALAARASVDALTVHKATSHDRDATTTVDSDPCALGPTAPLPLAPVAALPLPLMFIGVAVVSTLSVAARRPALACLAARITAAFLGLRLYFLFGASGCSAAPLVTPVFQILPIRRAHMAPFTNSKTESANVSK